MSSRPLGRAGEGLLEHWGGAFPISCFSTGASRTFFTADGGFFYRGHCWRHAPHDGGDGADAQEENLFSDRHWRHPHQGEAASSTHGFLCLFQPHPNLPQGEGVKANRIKHSKNGLPPLGEGWGGASIHHPNNHHQHFPHFFFSTKITTIFTTKPCVLTFVMRLNGLRKNDVRLEQFYLLQNVRFEHKLVRFEQ